MSDPYYDGNRIPEITAEIRVISALVSPETYGAAMEALIRPPVPPRWKYDLVNLIVAVTNTIRAVTAGIDKYHDGETLKRACLLLSNADILRQRVRERLVEASADPALARKLGFESVEDVQRLLG
jgi:hypothetical protein